jgi:hypothetical protein
MMEGMAIAIQFGERMQRAELGEDEVERLFREGKVSFLRITVNRLRME